MIQTNTTFIPENMCMFIHNNIDIKYSCHEFLHNHQLHHYSFIYNNSNFLIEIYEEENKAFVNSYFYQNGTQNTIVQDNCYDLSHEINISYIFKNVFHLIEKSIIFY